MYDRATWSGTNLRDYMRIPGGTLDNMIDFIIDGRGGGDFIRAIFEDSLSRAFRYGDERNLEALWAITTWVYNRAPEGSRREGFKTWKGLRSMYVGTAEQIEAELHVWRMRAIEGTVLA